MNAVRITVVCAAVLGTVYANDANDVTHYMDDVCRLDMKGEMSNESLPTKGEYLQNKTQEWLREMGNILRKWSGTETLSEKCKTPGTITVKGNTGLVGVMFFLEYMTILTSNEDKKVSTMLFHNCSKDNRSVELWTDIQKPLCYLLYYNDSQSRITTIDLCTDAIQNTSINGVMESLAGFGACLKNSNLSQCTQSLELFKTSGISKMKRRKGKRGKGKRRGKAKGRKRGKGSRKRDRKERKKGRKKSGRKGKKRNQNQTDKTQN